MQIFCKTIHVLTNSGTFLKCMSIILRKMRHLSFNMPNARSTHIRVELWTKFQWYSSRDNPSLWPLNRESIYGRQGYASSPIKTYGERFFASQNYLILILLHKFASCIDPTQSMSKSKKNICGILHLAMGWSGSPCGCSSLQRGAEVQWWVYANRQLPQQHMVFHANFGIHPQIYLWLNWDTANWLVERPILYKSAMLYME